MKLNLTLIDNEIIIKHFIEFNNSVEIQHKMAFDCYINSIEFIDDDIKFDCTRIKPIVCDGVDQYNVGESRGEIGDNFIINMDIFEGVYKDLLIASIREIKLNKISI